jgi:hypothetical protein
MCGLPGFYTVLLWLDIKSSKKYATPIFRINPEEGNSLSLPLYLPEFWKNMLPPFSGYIMKMEENVPLKN